MQWDDEFHASLRALRTTYKQDLPNFRDSSLDKAVDNCIQKDNRSKGWDRLMNKEKPLFAEVAPQAQYETFVPFILMKLSYMMNTQTPPMPCISYSGLSVSACDNAPFDPFYDATKGWTWVIRNATNTRSPEQTQSQTSLIRGIQRTFRKSAFSNICCNFGVAALALKLAREGISELPNTFPGLSQLLQEKYGETFEPGFKPYTYTKFGWTLPLHAAAAFTPLVLLVTRQIVNRSALRHTLMKMSCVLPSTRPEKLNKAELIVMDAVKSIADNEKSIEAALDYALSLLAELVQDPVLPAEHLYFSKPSRHGPATVFTVAGSGAGSQILGIAQAMSGSTVASSTVGPSYANTANGQIRSTHNPVPILANDGDTRMGQVDTANDQSGPPDGDVDMEAGGEDQDGSDDMDVDPPENTKTAAHSSAKNKTSAPRSSKKTSTATRHSARIKDKPVKPPLLSGGNNQGRLPKKKKQKSKNVAVDVESESSSSSDSDIEKSSSSSDSEIEISNLLSKAEELERDIKNLDRLDTEFLHPPDEFRENFRVFDHDCKHYEDIDYVTSSKKQLARVKKLLEAVAKAAVSDGRLESDGKTPCAHWKASSHHPVVDFDHNDLTDPTSSSGKIKAAFKMANIRIKNTPRREQPFTSQTFRANVGNPNQIREVQVGSRMNDRSVNVHVQASAKDIIEGVERGSTEVLNLLDCPVSPSRIQTPVGIDTGSVAAPEYLGEFTTDLRECWGIMCTKDATSPFHMDKAGSVTFLELLSGAKLWIIAYPRDPSIVPSTETIIQGFEKDFVDNNVFTVLSIILRPGQTFIMRPGVLHFVISFRPTMALGGHDYSSSSLFESGLAILHTFVAGGLFTNVDAEDIFPGLHRIVAFYAKYFSKEAEEYLDIIDGIKKSGTERSGEGYAQIPDLPNLYLLDDLKGLLMLIVIHHLGSLLSIHTYLGSLSDSQQTIYSTSNTYSKFLLAWIGKNFILGYQDCPDGEVVDSIPDDERLLAVFDRWLQDILIAMVDARRCAEEHGIQGASADITHDALTREIDKMFGTQARNTSGSYDFPAPPAGHSYEIRRRTE